MGNAYLKLNDKLGSMVENYLPDDELLDDLTGVFSIFSDKTRLRILSSLTITDMCVSDISMALKINQTTVSHQLRILRNLGAVNCYRSGKIVYYSLKDEILGDILLKGIEFLSK
ncbi:MAG: winged helix-turn-helix transcriptional regulator [Clostridia bacterium]|nr:winged helix-turn-helix transcriptional regulator [Clostridia bacterium]MBQ4099301.1 winged helix-turn-helix transcriptional regulator [Clostridia bacterium]